MSIVLFGVVSGAIWGPLVFGPMFSGRQLTAHDLVVPWIAAGAFTAAGLLVSFGVRPDPKDISTVYASPEPAEEPAAPLARDPAPARRRDRDGGGDRELRDHGRRDEPRGLRRGRAPPRAELDLHDHQPPHRRDVRPRARGRRRGGAHRAADRDRHRPARDGRVERRPGRVRLDRRDEHVPLRARARLVPRLRRREHRARRPGRALRAGAPGRAQRPALGALRPRPSRSAAASSTPAAGGSVPLAVVAAGLSLLVAAWVAGNGPALLPSARRTPRVRPFSV